MKSWTRLGASLALGVILAASAAVSPEAAASAQAAASAAARTSGLEQRYGAGLAAFEEVARRQLAAEHIAGVAIALLDGQDVWARAFGLADVENGLPMKPESSFRLASVTKPMTATAVLQLAEEGKIDLDAEIQTYVPYFPRKRRPVTVRQLLGHLGGITHYKNREKELHIKEHLDTERAIGIFADYDLVADPGAKYSYSSYGYNLLGAAVEGASGRSYGDYMREHVWGPLGMKDTRMDDPREVIPNRVRGYEVESGRLRNSEFVDVSSRFAAGGTRSTVLDLLRFAGGLMDGKLISKKSLDRMAQSMTLADGTYTDYGMGWSTNPLNGRFALAHSGSQNETQTFLVLLPARHAAIAAATNTESAGLVWFVRALAAQVYGERWDFRRGSSPYAPDPAARSRIAVLRAAFNEGLAHYERTGRAVTEDPAKLRAAFAYLRDSLRAATTPPELERAAKMRKAGVQPSTGEALTAVGSYAASVLAARRFTPEGLEAYHAAGPMVFFADYMRAYGGRGGEPRESGRGGEPRESKSPRIPKDLRFDSDLERRIGRWRRDWARTFGAATRGPFVSSDRIDAARLREGLAGASVYPDLSSDLSDVALRACGDGARDRGLEAAGLSASLYPDLAAPAVVLAGVDACFGDEAAARALLAKARGLEGGKEETGPGSLNDLAYELAEAGRLDGARTLLDLAIEIHPKEANLYDSLGELERRAGRTEESIAAYRKALELDPKLESSARALEALEKERAKPKEAGSRP